MVISKATPSSLKTPLPGASSRQNIAWNSLPTKKTHHLRRRGFQMPSEIKPLHSQDYFALCPIGIRLQMSGNAQRTICWGDSRIFSGLNGCSWPVDSAQAKKLRRLPAVLQKLLLRLLATGSMAKKPSGPSNQCNCELDS